MIATTEGINQLIRNNKHTIDVGKISDGYHTIDELYNHRIELWITVCRLIADSDRGHSVWITERHSDGELAFGGGWFVLGISNLSRDHEQLTYHLPMKYWKQCEEFAHVYERAPLYDGHTSEQVLERLKNL